MIKHSTVNVSNILHLSGGLRAITDQTGKLAILQTTERKAVVCNVTDTGAYAKSLKALGLSFIGHEEMWSDNGLENSFWHTFIKGHHPKSDVINQWSQISYGATKLENVAASELAHNIAFSLRTASLRLRDISREYEEQNLYAVIRKITPQMKFSNIRIFDLYMALHSFLVELCSARDYLACFISHHILSGINVDSMSKLYFKLKDKKMDHPIAALILQVCNKEDPDGWMARLTEFRNFIAHKAPISKLSESGRLSTKQLVLQEQQLHLVYVGIPADPVLSIDSNYVDALEQFYELLIKMLNFSRAVATVSGIIPEMVHFTDKDIIK